jgi:hypothetical protein
MSTWKTVRLITYGFLMGTAGISALTSDDAKNLYTHLTAAGKRVGGCAMKTVMSVKETCEDISAAADDINAKRAKAKREREIADAKAVLARTEAEEKAEAEAEAAAEKADAAAAGTEEA